METLSVLKDEHSAILRELYQMDRQVMLLESSGPVRGARILRELVETGKKLGENLSLHVGKEEKILFSVLEKRLGKDWELVEVMRREHEELLGSLESLRSELDRMIIDHDTVRTWNLTSKLQDLRGAMSDHLSREEKVLFWLAELRLSRSELESIAFSLRGILQVS